MNTTEIPVVPMARCALCGAKYPAPLQIHHSKVECLRNQLYQAEAEEMTQQQKIQVAMSYVVHRAKILLEATNDHAELVAKGKLKDAVASVERLQR